MSKAERVKPLITDESIATVHAAMRPTHLYMYEINGQHIVDSCEHIRHNTYRVTINRIKREISSESFINSLCRAMCNCNKK